MLRYVIGISLITAAIIVIRILANGKISRRLQYALWIFIPLYMVASNLTAIPVKVPAHETNVVQETAEYVQNNGVIENSNLIPRPLSDADMNSHESESEPNVTSKIIHSINWPSTLRNITFFVAGLIIAAVGIYNLGFVIYCGRRRKFLRRDDATSLNVYLFNHSSSPFLLGKTIYLSSDVADSDMAEYAIWHEYCHYRHGDTFWSAIRYIVFAFNWYNPLIWYAFMLCEQDCEMACDEAVLRVIGSNRNVEYGKVLLHMLSGKVLGKQDFFITTAMNGRSKEFMRRRIINIKNPARGSAVAVCSSLIMAVLVTGCAMIKIEQMQPELPVAQPLVSVSSEPAELVAQPDLEVVEASIPAVTSSDNEITPYFDIREIDGVQDGYYTVILRRDSLPTADGRETCRVYFWDNYRVSQETIDSFMEEEVSLMMSRDYNVYPGSNYQILADEITFERSDEFSLLGTDYSGEICYVDSEHTIYYCKLKNEDSWDMFTGYRLPVICVNTSFDCTLRTSPDLVIYDGTVLLEPDVQQHLATLTPEEIQDVLEFRETTLTRGAISSISEFREFRGDYPLDEYEYVVIKVDDALVTEIYFWYLP